MATDPFTELHRTATVSDSTARELLDCARVAREVASLTALVLFQSEGDPYRALEVLRDGREQVQPTSMGELDAVAISEQAIREMLSLLGED